MEVPLFAPASAGKPSRIPIAPPASPDHPRSRGETIEVKNLTDRHYRPPHRSRGKPAVFSALSLFRSPPRSGETSNPATGPSRSAAVCAGLFRERAALRPLWLGVGAAWTGIDLSDTRVSAQDDVLLTDLVIPRLPYGCNRSLSHARRRKIVPVSEQREMLMMLRQGLGRLVRREGVQDRRIWIGDRRLLRDSGAYRTIRRVFEGYRSDE